MIHLIVSKERYDRLPSILSTFYLIDNKNPPDDTLKGFTMNNSYEQDRLDSY